MSPRPALFAAILALCAALPAAADLPVRRTTENLGRGLRFEIKLTAIAQAPSDPRVIYVGSEHGRVHISRDGGASWEESTALTRRGAFYGAIRKQDTRYRPPRVSFERLFPPSRMTGTRTTAGLRSLSDDNPNRPLDADDIGFSGASGEERFYNTGYVSGIGTAFQRRVGSTSTLRATFDDLFDARSGAGGGGGGGAGSDLAVGIRSGAPRLAYQVRRKRGWGIGINLQQTLALRAAPATGIWFFDVDPRDPKRVLAATADGLRLSRDGGYSWPLVLTGPTRWERAINHIARSPHDPELLLAGTGRGLHVSRDGGESWEPLDHPFVVASDIRWVDFDRTRPDVFYAGATWGLLRTADFGRSFDIAFRSPWPAESLVRQVQIDPHRPERVWLATADGLLASVDDGKTFERAGGLLFVGTNVRCLSPGEAPGHLIAVTDTEVWETRDGGENWQIALFGRVQWKITYGMFELGRPESMLILTEAEVLRFGPAERARPVPEAIVERFRRQAAREPSQAVVVETALRRAGLYRPELIATRRRARWASLMPRVDAVAGWREIRVDNAQLRIRTTLADDDPELTRRPDGIQEGFAWGVFARWDLAGLVFDRSEAPIARIGRGNSYAEWSLRSTVINVFQERRRLMFEALLDAEEDARTRLMRDLRIDELTATLDLLTDGLFAAADDRRADPAQE